MTKDSLDSGAIDALESAAQVLINRALYRLAVGVYGRLLELAPSHSMGWYGAGEAFFRQAADDRDPELALAGLACARRALVEDQSNVWAAQLEGTITSGMPLTAEQIEGCTACDDAATLSEQVAFDGAALADGVAGATSWEERMLLVGWLGKHVDPCFVELIVRSAMDDNEMVRQAALDTLLLPEWITRGPVRERLEQLATAEGNRPSTAALLVERLRGLRGDGLDPATTTWAGELLSQLEG